MFPTLIDNIYEYLLLLQFLSNKGHVPNKYLVSNKGIPFKS